MLLTYRRTGGVCALLTLSAVALAGAALAVIIGATVLVIALAVAAVALVARVLLPAWSWRRAVPPATPWPHETFDTAVVNRTTASDADILRMDSDKG